VSREENKIFWIALTILVLGLFPGYWLANLHFPNDLANDLWRAALGIGAVFYFLLMMPLMDLLRRVFRRRQEPESYPSPADDIRLVGTDEPVRWGLMLRVLSNCPDRNTPEQAAKLDAVKRLPASRE